MAGFAGPIASGLIGAISGNIAQKAAAKNADNAQNIGLNRNQQAGAAATGALNNYWSQNPFFNMQAPTAPGAVSGAQSPSMQAPAPTPAPSGPGQAGAPPGNAAPQGQQIPPQLLQALMQMLSKQGQPPGQPPGGMQGQAGMQRPPGMSLPQAPQIAAPMTNPQQLLAHIYGQGR